MVFDSWRENLKFTGGLGSGRRTLSRPPRRKPAARRRLQLEPLEDRFLLSSFTVTNTADSGTGSFRAAIGQVNADTQAGTDTIHFAIGSGVQTIRPLSLLPTITHSVVIDGTSRPGFAGTPLINLSGVSTSGNGLTITANNSIIKDLDIRQFDGNGVDIVGSGNVLQGNYLGTDATGTAANGNGTGLEIDGTSNTVGGTTPSARNLISGNVTYGVTIKGPKNLVEGNFIGTDVTGTKALGNTYGLIITAPSNVLGGTAPGAGNLISANKARSVYLTQTVSSQANCTVVQGNYIGTDVTGTRALHNGMALFLDGVSSNLIGGTTAGARNLLAEGFAVHGLSGNVVQGNYMGTDVTGKIVLVGVVYSFSPHLPTNTVGGTTPAAGNLIYSEPVILAGRVVVLSAAPVLTSAVSSNGTVTIGGTFHRGLNSAYTLNFFSDAAGTIPIGSSIVTTNATGTATFTATFSGVLSAGEVITATSGDGLYNTSMLSAGLAVAPTIVVPGFPSAVSAGAARACTVTALDAFGNQATAFAATVHFAGSDPQALLPADYTFTAADQGVHTFTGLKLKKKANHF